MSKPVGVLLMMNHIVNLHTSLSTHCLTRGHHLRLHMLKRRAPFLCLGLWACCMV